MFKVAVVNKHYGTVNKHDPLITDLYVTDDTDTDIGKLEKCQTIKNPAVEFTNKARNAEFDDLSDEEFKALLEDTKRVSAFWSDKPEAGIYSITYSLLQNYTNTARPLFLSKALLDLTKTELNDFSKKQLAQEEIEFLNKICQSLIPEMMEAMANMKPKTTFVKKRRADILTRLIAIHNTVNSINEDATELFNTIDKLVKTIDENILVEEVDKIDKNRMESLCNIIPTFHHDNYEKESTNTDEKTTKT